MSSSNLSPRQRMINMMYLVLTAMLALNVSAEILRAFSLINKSLEETSRSVIVKNKELYKSFEDRFQKEPLKSKPYYDKAISVKKNAQSILNFLKETKEIILDKAGTPDGVVNSEDFKTDEDLKRSIDEGNIDISSIVLVDPEGRSPRGLELQKRINDFRKILLSVVDIKDRKSVKIYLDNATDPPGKKINWLQKSFSSMPVAGVVTLLTKLESDVLNSETEVVSYLLNQIDAASYKFDKIESKVLARTNYVLAGQDYEADIMLVAYDTRQELDIRIDGGSKIDVENGVGKYKSRATSEGIKKWGGYISVVSPTSGEITRYPFASEYIVAKPVAVVSPDKMNVLYVGVDNPISISVPGITPENLVPKISGNSSLKGNLGKYVARVNVPGGTVNIDVFAKTSDNKGQQLMGTSIFRVRTVPNPIASVGGLISGNVSSSQFKAQGGLVALLKDFEFDMIFRVISYRVLYLSPRREIEIVSNTGAVYAPSIQKIIRGAKPNDRFIFDDIKVVGEDNVIRKLPSVVYSLN